MAYAKQETRERWHLKVYDRHRDRWVCHLHFRGEEAAQRAMREWLYFTERDPSEVKVERVA